MSGQALLLDDREPLLAFLEDRLRSPMLEGVLLAPLREFLGRSGKQLRARFVAMAWQLAGGRGEPPAALPLALELLHAGSLIVDAVADLSDLSRRGSEAVLELLDVGLCDGRLLRRRGCQSAERNG